MYTVYIFEYITFIVWLSETTNASVEAPLGIIYTCFATGIGGVLYLMALLFATADIDSALDGETKIVAINVFRISCGDQLGSLMVRIPFKYI